MNPLIAALIALAVCASALSPRLFTRYGRAIGMTLWKWNRKKVEIWFTPADYSPPEHAHDNCNTEFTILWARNRRIYRKTHTICSDGGGKTEVLKISSNPKFFNATGDGDSYIANTPGVWGKWLSVRAGVPHKFEKGTSCMIWLVVETWRAGSDMSLANDFRITE